MSEEKTASESGEQRKHYHAYVAHSSACTRHANIGADIWKIGAYTSLYDAQSQARLYCADEVCVSWWVIEV